MGDFSDSLWFRTTTGRPVGVDLQDTVAVDVAVIGGGFLGLSAALHLAESGIEVAVAEANQIGFGASSRNGGFVVPHFAKGGARDVTASLGETGERLVGLVGNSARNLFDLIDRLGIACDAERGGWFQTAHSPAAMRAAEQRADEWLKAGQPITLHDRSAIERLTGLTGYAGGWSNATGGTVHPLKLVHGLAQVATMRGARIFENTEIRAAQREGKRWRLTSDRGLLQAEQVLVCTNAQSAALFPELAQAIVPVTICQIATEPIDASERRHLLGQGQALSDMQTNLFTYRFDVDWRLITGGVPLFANADSRSLGARLARRLQLELKLAKPPRVEYQWSGQASVSPSFLPRLYEMNTGMFAPTACNGRGVALCVEAGRVLAEATRTGAWRDVPLPLQGLRTVRARRLARWGVRWYPLYGAVKDRLERSEMR